MTEPTKAPPALDLTTPDPTSIRPTVGRIVYVFAPERWVGPRAAQVTGVLNVNGAPAFESDETQSLVVNVNVQLDAVLDETVLRRSRPSMEHDGAGDVLVRAWRKLTLYDALKPEDRPAGGVWAEWMAYQVGQAKKQDTLTDVWPQIVRYRLIRTIHL